jgi:hypothetical protein
VHHDHHERTRELTARAVTSRSLAKLYKTYKQAHGRPLRRGLVCHCPPRWCKQRTLARTKRGGTYVFVCPTVSRKHNSCRVIYSVMILHAIHNAAACRSISISKASGILAQTGRLEGVRLGSNGSTKWNTDPRKARVARADDRTSSRNGLPRARVGVS